jgi:TRAP transporter TAXI family solute receptor
MTITTEEPSDRDGTRIWTVLAMITLAGFAVAWQFVGPSVPKTIVMATGSEAGTYHAFGELYKQAFEPYGIDIVLRPTAGSLENIELLATGEVDLAFVQGGTVPEHRLSHVAGVASLYFEPLWIFHRSGLKVQRLGDLAGRRVQVGPAGSGTRTVALELLEVNAVTADNSDLLELSTDAAIDALLSGELDALCVVGGARSGPVARLMAEEGRALKLFDVPRGLAYERSFRHLREVVLAEGVLDPAQNIPDRDIRLMAATAGLLSTHGLHEALAPLLIETARDIHGVGDVFEVTGDFPAGEPMDVRLSASSKHYFDKGPSFLYRVLPFAPAATLDRLLILLFPLLTLLLPLLKVAPPLYRWRIRSKIYRWYRVLYQVEHDLHRADADTAVEPYLEQLSKIEHEIQGVKVPPSYMEELYNMRMHLSRVQAELRARLN